MQKPSLDYLRELNKDENDRQSTAENKCVQIISSSGIFLTIIGLMISLLVTSRDLIELWFKVVLVVLVVLIIFFYVKSIIIAFDGLDPKKYFYQRGLPETVNEFDNETDFNEQLVKDYISSINANFILNNKKFGYVIKARKKFINGIYTTALMIVSLIIYIAFFYIKEKEGVQKIAIVSNNQPLQLLEIKKSLDSIKNEIAKRNSNEKTKVDSNNLKKPTSHFTP
jgi:hypothetical protein